MKMKFVRKKDRANVAMVSCRTNRVANLRRQKREMGGLTDGSTVVHRNN